MIDNDIFLCLHLVYLLRFFKFIFNWRIIALHYCVTWEKNLKKNEYICVCVCVCDYEPISSKVLKFLILLLQNSLFM